MIAITNPPAGAVYTLGQAVAAAYACSDDDSGVDSCLGTVANGQPICTTSVGTKSFSVTAAVNATNTATLTYQYAVVFDFRGFAG